MRSSELQTSHEILHGCTGSHYGVPRAVRVAELPIDGANAAAYHCQWHCLSGPYFNITNPSSYSFFFQIHYPVVASNNR